FEAQQSMIGQLKHGLLAIFIAGALALLITNPALAQNFALAGYDANGNLDADFGGDGKVTTSFGNGLNGSATAIAVDSSGRVVAVGTVNSQFALTRYKKDGSLDTTFGSGAGMVLTAFLNSYSASASAVAIDQQGRIVVAGTTTT
ncbi:MAG: hypothetical protein M3X11_10330, partial [Acidobacteriota bacterium]|nr:hypothetical protein [Acidobacteriota bacterium]